MKKARNRQKKRPVRMALLFLLGFGLWMTLKSTPDLTPARRQELEAADRDLLGDLELAKRDDPTFDSLAGYLPAMKRSREVVGVKYHPHDIGVAPDASLELSDDVDAPGSPVAFFEVGDLPVRFGAAPDGCSKSLEGGLIVAATFHHQNILYRQRIFGYSERLSPDAELWAYLMLEAQPEARALVGGGTEVRFCVLPETALNPPRSWKFEPTPEASGKVFLKIPFDIKNQKFQEISKIEFDAKMNLVSDFWAKDLGSGMRVEVPETRVNEAVHAWLAYASLDVDRRKGVLEPHDGAGFYEQIYGYSAALYPNALDLWGRHGEARECLESLLTFQTADGLFYQNFGTPDPGALLFSLCAHYELTGDAEWLRRVAPKMAKIADWIIRKRRESMTMPGAQKTVTYGLIKFRPYCDHPDPVYDYFGDTYCAAGIEKTAQALAEIGLKAEAERIGREAAAYRQDILASMDAAVVKRGGMKVLPMEPDTLRILKSSNDRAAGYYGLIASCMLESEFLPATDERTGWIMRFMEGKGGLRLGMSEFAGGIDHAYTYGYWLNCLKLDRVRPVILGFYGSLAYGMSRETYSGVEVTKLFTGDNEPTLPHLYSCTQQLRLLRMMLIREDGENLWVGQAVPKQWLEEGKQVKIKGAPTRFGPISLTIEPRPGRGQIFVELTPPARQTPKIVFLRLRHPGDRRISGVKIDGKKVNRYTSDTISLEAPQGTLRIRVSY